MVFGNCFTKWSWGSIEKSKFTWWCFSCQGLRVNSRRLLPIRQNEWRSRSLSCFEGPKWVVIAKFRASNYSIGCYYLWEVRFNSLNELVQYHMEHSISRTSNLLLRETQSNRPPPQNHGGQSRSGPTFQARAAYTFNGEENNEISFDQGDTITVHVHLQNQFNLSKHFFPKVDKIGKRSPSVNHFQTLPGGMAKSSEMVAPLPAYSPLHT